MEFSEEFIAIVREAALECQGVAEFVSLRNIEWNEREQCVYLRCSIRETKDGPECGHGMSLRFVNFIDMCFFYNGAISTIRTNVIWSDIRKVVPDIHKLFTYGKHLEKRNHTLKELRRTSQEQEEEIEYLKAKLIIIDYEKKQKEKEDDELPF